MLISDWSSDVCSSDLFVDAAFVLDGEVGDAASRVEAVRCGDCAGWTYVDAARAGAAVGGRRRLDRQRQVDVDFAAEAPRSDGPVDQAGVIADPRPGEGRVGTGCVSTCRYRLAT